MLRALQALFVRHLNLDIPDEGDEIEVVIGQPLAARGVWRLIRLLCLQALTDGASAIHFFHLAEDDSYRMCYCIADVWYEMVPAPREVMLQTIAALRRKSRIMGSRQAGGVRYVRGGKVLAAHCVSPAPDNLRIYFTVARPALLDVKGGCVPGPGTAPSD